MIDIVKSLQNITFYCEKESLETISLLHFCRLAHVAILRTCAPILLKEKFNVVQMYIYIPEEYCQSHDLHYCMLANKNKLCIGAKQLTTYETQLRHKKNSTIKNINIFW